MKKFINKHQNIFFVIADIFIIILGYILATIFLTNSINFNNSFISQILISIAIYELYINIFKLYQNMVRYEIGVDYTKYLYSSILSIITISVINLLLGNFTIYHKINVLSGTFIVGALIIYRMIIRNILNKIISTIEYKNNSEKKQNNLLIIGAGMSAKEIINTIKNNMPNKYNIIGLIDDDLSKLHRKILGVKVIGTRFDITKIVNKYDVDLIFFAINKVDSINRRKILEICQEANVKTRVLPTTEKIIDEQGALNSLRDVEIEDLLGREAIKFDDKDISNVIKGKTILVTGGGGSIGSELCRQIANYKPKQLIIFDIYENNLYDIEMELRNMYPKLNLQAVVGSVRDKNRLENVFSTYRPEIVFHAAAHKHVPLMENSPLEAIKNNIFGTYNTAIIADKYAVKNFVLISTDKAVNPTNIMGASKRVCEMIIQTLAKKSKTIFAAVRFGNVLGSNGSVIPLFKKQIERGGPVTVTDKEITRFFMTIPEAVQLILQALTYAKGGEIFVLNMGEPVKIYDLAVSLIKLMGFEPNVDIPIDITGLRPGEKLYEEILMAEEGLTATEHNKIFISNPININDKELKNNLKKLSELNYNSDYKNSDVIRLMKETVSTFKDPKEVNNTKKEYIKNERRKN